jgi:hypothetical protein
VAERADRAAVAGQVGMVSMMSMDEEEQSAEAKQCLTALKEGKRRAGHLQRPQRLVKCRDGALNASPYRRITCAAPSSTPKMKPT